MSLYTLSTVEFERLDGILYRTTREIVWEMGFKGSGWFYAVPSGTVFDVSIPRLLWPILSPHDRRFLKGAVLHDRLLVSGVDRVTAAGTFNAALAADGVSRAKRFAMTLAVAFYRFT